MGARKSRPARVNSRGTFPAPPTNSREGSSHHHGEEAASGDSTTAAHFKYIVLGGGTASGYVAKEFVDNDLKAGELAIIGEEPVCAYERPILSKDYLTAKGARLPDFSTCVGVGCEQQDDAWYKSRGITFMTSTCVASVDIDASCLMLENGNRLTYEKLIIATGSSPVHLEKFKISGFDLDGIYYLQNLADAENLLSAMDEVKKSGGQAVVFGGDSMGMEVAAALATYGIPTKMVLPSSTLNPGVFPPSISSIYESFYKGKGITILSNHMITCFSGPDMSVASVEIQALDSGKRTTIDASLVVACAGSVPNVHLFAQQLKLGPLGGIEVDSRLCSSNKDVFAVGDVAEFPLKLSGGALVRQEHVDHARQSAAHAVRSILGSTAEYDYVPCYHSLVFNLHWAFYGLNEGAEAVLFGDHVVEGEPKHGAYFVKQGKVVGVFLESGSPEENLCIKTLARAQPHAPEASTLATLGLKFAAQASI